VGISDQWYEFVERGYGPGMDSPVRPEGRRSGVRRSARAHGPLLAYLA
jgi:hypothetical protein